MSIYFHKEDRDIPSFDQKKIIAAVDAFCSMEKKIAGNINFIYCSDNYLLEMNNKYLGHDYYTDIITFNYNEENYVSGDIFMSRERIEENAINLGANPDDEFIRLCGHGLFHLLGMNDADDDEKAEMRKKEEDFINWVKGA